MNCSMTVSVRAETTVVSQRFRPSPRRPKTVAKKNQKHPRKAVSRKQPEIQYSSSEKVPGCKLLSRVPV